MPLLVYFVTGSPAAPLDVKGVADGPVDIIDVHELAVCYSQLHSLPQETNILAEEAVRFFHVQQAGFASASIVPFRFPSLFTDEAALHSFLSTEAEVLRKTLTRVNAMSQFDIRITTLTSDHVPQSGTDYLRIRASRSAALDKAEALCRELLADVAKQWEVRHYPDRTTLHALVPRHLEQQVADRFRALPPPSDCRLVVLGPWPPGAFVQTGTQASHA